MSGSANVKRRIIGGGTIGSSSSSSSSELSVSFPVSNSCEGVVLRGQGVPLRDEEVLVLSLVSEVGERGLRLVGGVNRMTGSVTPVTIIIRNRFGLWV